MPAITILEPWNGDILNRHDGTLTPAGLEIEVRGQADGEGTVTVACEEAERPGGTVVRRAETSAPVCNGQFRARILLQGRHNLIMAAMNGQRAACQVLWDYDSQPRYRFSVDDNILFLRDLADSNYSSLFEHPYLAFWQSVHRRYGTKVHFNIYFETDASVYPSGSFRLRQLSGRFRSEWEANSDWLHLTFHARSNKPDWPYRDATYERMAADYDAVTAEIKRFAGEAVLSSVTTVHWACAPRPAVKALRERGVRGLIGLFHQQLHGGAQDTGYYLEPALAEHVAGRDYWWDPELDMCFISCDAVVNTYPPEAVPPRLDEVGGNAHTGELIELLIHEQYFRRELSLYQPDVQQRVLAAVDWVSRRGYKPVFWGDGFIGA